MKHIIISGALALAAITGCAVDDARNDGATTSSVEQDTTASVLGCTVISVSPANGQGEGSVDCPSNTTSRQLQVCLQQLVTGGWENVGGIACSGVGPISGGGGLGSTEPGVSYYTANRWYRTQTWVSIQRQGQSVSEYVYSDSCKGNGAQGCN
jgi:hypothetical protein